MESVATASIGPLRRRAPSARSPSHAQQQQAVVSRGIPRGSPPAVAAAAAVAAGQSSSGGDRRCWSWCRTFAFGVCICLLAVAVLAVLQYVKPSDTSSSGVGGSAHGTSTSNLVRQQQQRHRRTATRAHHAPGEKERETAPTSNSIVKQKNQWDYSSRFPRFGTPEHTKACGGRETVTRMETSTKNKCSVLVRPDPSGTEGLALWVSNVVMAYFIHRQIANGACFLYIDFGVGVNVEAALTTPTAPDRTAAPLWTVPPKGFVCRIEDNCHYIWTEPSGSAYRYSYRPFLEGDSAAATAKGRRTQGDAKHHQEQEEQLAAVPFYRFAYNPRYEKLNADTFMELERSLTGQNNSSFDVHTGFACAFSLLFKLSPEAGRYEPNLFNQILPTIQDPHNLVVGIYIRTGATEGKTSAGVGYEAVDDAEAHIAAAAEMLSCALKQETRFVSGDDEESGDLLRGKPEPQRIVWMLITDSQHLKKYISKEYGGKDVVVVGGDTADDPTPRTRTIPRDVITTSSQGAHTRPRGAANNNESDGDIDTQRTEAFASAVIDWWLLGESDVSTSTDKLRRVCVLGSVASTFVSDKIQCSPYALLFAAGNIFNGLYIWQYCGNENGKASLS